MDYAEVILWGRTIGVVAWDSAREIGNFEYKPEFLASGIELAPFTMPLGPRIFSFPELDRRAFRGLPGLLADCLPDKFGNLLIDQWLLRSGRSQESFSPIERLCYIGTRGMGALEFRPAIRKSTKSSGVEIAELVALASQALQQKASLQTQLTEADDTALEAMQDILRVGTSAGGARAKAVIAWNRKTNEVRSGQVSAPDGFEYWLMKFDGVSGNRDKELEDPAGYGKIEFGYYLMATAAGIHMSPCQLWHENGRSHFMTKRFDRSENGKKLMMQSLCALGHYDFNHAGAYSYEQALELARKLHVSTADMNQLYRRMVFNVLARNQDDHTKNIAFMMDRSGNWSLSPAFDVTYSYNPQGAWTSRHQMSLNGKREEFALEDMLAVARLHRVIGQRRATEAIEEVAEAVGRWPDFAEQADVLPEDVARIQATHRSLEDLRSQ